MTTVRQLVDNLIDFDQDLEVAFGCGVREFTLDTIEVADDGAVVVELNETA